MAKHVIDHKITKTWQLNASGDTWIVAKNGEIDFYGAALNTAYGIVEDAAYKNNRIDVAGDISVTGAITTIGIHSLGKSTDIVLRASSSIDATYAVWTGGVGASIENHADLKVRASGLVVAGDQSTATNYGSIDADSAITAYGADCKLYNEGEFRGETGITMQGEGDTFFNSGNVDAKLNAVAVWNGGTIVNQATGVLTGNSTVYIDAAGGEMTLTNKGLIAGSIYAVVSKSTTVDHIVNSGVIVGDVLLGAGDDVFNTSKGSFHGEVHGGVGDDTYLINDPGIKCVELAGEGTDTLKTSVTVSLADNIENLTVIGKGAVTAAGNDLGNIMTGNSADNQLMGNAGEDKLQGGAGNDYLIGGSDTDLFMFRKGSDHDVVSDFKADDLIGLKGFAGVNEFDDLAGKMTDNTDGGVDIDMGNGDVITINLVTVNQLSALDFWIVPVG